MAGPRLSLDLFVSCCFFLTVGSHQESVSPPRNVSLVWKHEFWPQLSWAPPQHSMDNCSYKVTMNGGKFSETNIKNQFYVTQYFMEGGFLQMGVETTCGDIHSEPVVLNITYPELVRNVNCYITAATKSHCFWSPASQAPDLRFFWSVDSGSGIPSSGIQECPSYNYTDPVRPGCDLEADIHQTIYIFFNATLMDTVARNTFSKDTLDDVRPPSIKWSVNKTGDKFSIAWIEPDIPLRWNFVVMYTECSETKYKTFGEVNSGELDLVPHCPYCLAIKAHITNRVTPWTKEECFDADTDPKAWKWAAIIIPLILVGLMALMFGCYRKNKEYILPRVPQPRDLLSGISDNNNKSTVPNLYVPTEEEEENCNISLVADPLINTPDF
ncbi:uncharacterized protein LOC120822644 isoform X2 [Gasterosteus aculeatus]